MQQLFSAEGEWFWQMCQFLVVAGSLVFILRQLRLQSHSHLVNSFKSLGDRWDAEMMLRARKRVCEQHAPGQIHIDPAMHYVCLFFEEIGAYARKGILDEDLIWELYSFEIEHYWIICKNAISEYRKSCNDTSFYYLFERLHGRMKIIGSSRGVAAQDKTDNEVKNFITHEKIRVGYFLEPDRSDQIVVEGIAKNNQHTPPRKGRSGR